MVEDAYIEKDGSSWLACKVQRATTHSRRQSLPSCSVQDGAWFSMGLRS